MWILQNFHDNYLATQLNFTFCGLNQNTTSHDKLQTPNLLHKRAQCTFQDILSNSFKEAKTQTDSDYQMLALIRRGSEKKQDCLWGCQNGEWGAMYNA